MVNGDLNLMISLVLASTVLLYFSYVSVNNLLLKSTIRLTSANPNASNLLKCLLITPMLDVEIALRVVSFIVP